MAPPDPQRRAAANGTVVDEATASGPAAAARDQRVTTAAPAVPANEYAADAPGRHRLGIAVGASAVILVLLLLGVTVSSI